MKKIKKNSKIVSNLESLFKFSLLFWAISVVIFIAIVLSLRVPKDIIKSKSQTNNPPTPTSTNYQQQNQQQKQPQDDGEPWGVAKQVGPHTYTMKVGMDDVMSTPQEAFVALNEYRYKSSREKLSWSDTLASYATSRSDLYNSIGNTDEHAGFNDFLENQDGFQKLGFNHVGENGSYGYRLNGVHLIEWMYASDEGHNSNQLSSDWSHVGIGITGTSTNFIFGGN